ncbi:MAG: class I SAM-dependent methyltransferase [Acidobacteriota bacterium]|nr:class I SAM-dependent methyltransferase [Acidobacteriota bacterium]
MSERNSERVVYIGKDLEAMSFAVNYHNWILDEFRPFLGANIVEVGSGTGSFSELLLREKPETLNMVEPSEMFVYLKQNISQLKAETETHFYQAVFAQVCDEIAARKKPDSIIYVNVLEHIEDDSAELKMIYETLKPGGRCFIFVPALMSLYGEFDRKIGHFRRYTKIETEEKCAAAGFKILKSKYFDFAGIFPWYVKYKLLKSDSLESGAVTAYDKFAVPLISRFESFFNFPVGKNVLLIAEK